MQLTFMTEQFEHWHRIAHDRLVSANQLLDRARKAEEALREILFLRPAGNCTNKLIGRAEMIAMAALRGEIANV
jgi:hypothetical protein